MLKAKVTTETTWVRVGNNAEMVAWSALQLQHCPYPLDIALERFYTGQTQKHSAPGTFWHHSGVNRFACLVWQVQRPPNHRSWHQRNQAGLLSPSPEGTLRTGIYLQEAMTIFATNFIRWATVWIRQHVEQNEHTLPLAKMGIKKQVQVAAHTSAKVIQNSQVCC